VLALPAAAGAALALTAVRHQALFFAAAAPFAAHALAAASPGARSARTERRLAAAVVALAFAVTLWCAAPPASGPLRARHGSLRWGFGLAPGRFPVRAAERLAAVPAVGPLYNELAHGGYLLWRLHPPRQVFLDGRMELEPELLGELERARSDPRQWETLLRREGAVGALVRYQPRPVPIVEPDGRGGFRRVGESTPNAVLFPRERWRLVDFDDETMLFLLPEATGWSEPPFVAVEPEDVGATLRGAAGDAALRAAALAELDRKLAAQPDCRRALWLRAELTRAPGGAGAPAPRASEPPRVPG
jgi:hypothetical protein